MPLCKVDDTPFYIQGVDNVTINSVTFWSASIVINIIYTMINPKDID